MIVEQKSVLNKIWLFSFAVGISNMFLTLIFPLFIINVPNWELYTRTDQPTNDMLNLIVMTVSIFSDFIGRVFVLIK